MRILLIRMERHNFVMKRIADILYMRRHAPHTHTQYRNGHASVRTCCYSINHFDQNYFRFHIRIVCSQICLTYLDVQNVHMHSAHIKAASHNWVRSRAPKQMHWPSCLIRLLAGAWQSIINAIFHDHTVNLPIVKANAYITAIAKQTQIYFDINKN